MRFRHKIIWNFFKNKNNEIQIGYFKEYPEYNELNLDDCHLYDKRMTTILTIARKWATHHNLSIYHHTEKKGLLRSITLRHSTSSDEWMIGITTTQEDFSPNIWEDFIEKVKKEINLVSFYWRKAPVHEVISKVHTDTHIWGQSYITQKCAHINFQIQFGDFFQNNVGLTEKMIEYVNDHIEQQPDTHILDLYCGVGTFTLPIAKNHPTINFTGIEYVESAIQSAQKNASINNITNTHFICGDVNAHLDDLLTQDKYDTIIVDPPRAGLKANVIASLIERPIKQLIYISCNAQTMFKDLNKLAETYTTEHIQPFDMFPQTYHVELIAILKLKNSQ